jgi:hypothetical protein
MRNAESSIVSLFSPLGHPSGRKKVAHETPRAFPESCDI